MDLWETIPAKQDHRDTVADALFIDLFAQPHTDHRTCGEHQNDGGSQQEVAKSISAVYNRTAAVEQLIVTKGLDQSQTNGDISGDLVQSLSALSASLAICSRAGIATANSCTTMLAVMLWGNRKCEQSCVLERAAGQHIQKSQQVSIAKSPASPKRPGTEPEVPLQNGR